MHWKRTSALIHGVQTLFESGAIGQQTDGELLRVFCERRDRTADHAFAALVERHGPMVLRVCRSILQDEHDAQDAFQATFLVLVRRSHSVRNRESIGSWLYGVALRVAACARASLAHRRKHERRAADRAPSGVVLDAGRHEIAEIIHEELGRLPERNRAVLLLCHLEGLTCEAAACRLGWPIGTVKSRLSRGRELLLRRLIRRGLGPDDTSKPHQPHCAALPAALLRDTVQAMLQLAGPRQVSGLVSLRALYYARKALSRTLISRALLVPSLLLAGLIAAAGAAFALPKQEPTRTGAAAQTTAKDAALAKQAEAPKSKEILHVHVVDTSGQGVPNVEVEVRDRNRAEEVGRFRTGPGGWLTVAADELFNQIEFEARPDAQTLGWAIIRSGELSPTGREDDPVNMVLLPLNHRVEGSIVDVRGKPIRGATVQVVQLDHDVNRFAMGYGTAPPEASLGSAVTDQAGKYAITLPQGTRALLSAHHPRYVGPNFGCQPEDRAVEPVTLRDAGGVAGTVINSITKQPVAGAQVGVQLVEHHDTNLGSGGRGATTDAGGGFVIGGLEPGIYNLLFYGNPKDKALVARAVEGVRVKAGEDTRADLSVTKGRRLRGVAIDTVTNKRMAGESIMCYSVSHPRSGAACESARADELGRFEFFVPPGPVFVYIGSGGLVGRSHKKHLKVPDDRDPEPVVLERRYPRGFDPSSSPYSSFKCTLHVRMAGGEARQRAGGRTLSGRVFDPDGLPIASVRVHYNASKKFVESATDRLGIFRLKGLPSRAASYRPCQERIWTRFGGRSSRGR